MIKKSELKTGMIIVDGQFGGGIVDLEKNLCYPLNTAHSYSLSMYNEDLETDIHEIYNIKAVYDKIKGVGKMKQLQGLFENSNLITLFGKMLKEHSQATEVLTLLQSLERLPKLGVMDVNGNCAILDGSCPKTESGFTLSELKVVF